jgi:polar amino acid transport system substrate-binding protein
MKQAIRWKVVALAIFLATTTLSLAADNVLIVDVRKRPPEMTIEGGQFSGPLLDVIKEAAQKIGYEVKFVERQFEGSLTLLQQGEKNIDLLPRTVCTEERAKLIDYLGPIGYQQKDILFLVKPGQEDTVKTFDDLKTIKIGVKRGTYYFKEFNESKDLVKVESDDDDNMVKMFAAGRFDIMAIIDKKAAETALEKNGILEYAYAKYRQPIQIGNYYGITQGHPLKDALQKGLEEMVTSGRVKSIYESYGAESPGFDPALGFEKCFSD